MACYVFKHFFSTAAEDFFFDVCYRCLAGIIPRANMASMVIFALSFFAVRNIWWPAVSLEFWTLSVKSLRDGTAHSNAVVGVFLVGNIFLTGLQFFWGFLLLKKVRKTLQGQSKKSKAG